MPRVPIPCVDSLPRKLLVEQRYYGTPCLGAGTAPILCGAVVQTGSLDLDSITCRTHQGPSPLDPPEGLWKLKAMS